MRVYNGGTYDLLHVGHLYVFKQMRDWAGRDGEVIIGLNTDEFVEEFKGHKTVQSYLERSEILSAIKYIDRIVPNVGGKDSTIVLDAIRPDYIAAGHDWYSPDDEKYCKQMGFTKEWLRDRDISLVYMKWMPGYSSTNIRSNAGSV
jgi:glycerol-3-phosphate cytidylyltransferase